MTKTISGSFEVDLKPLEHSAQDPLMGRMSIDKKFSGTLSDTSRGEILTARTAVD